MTDYFQMEQTISRETMVCRRCGSEHPKTEWCSCAGFSRPPQSLQAQLDALSDDSQWSGGWYQPIEFPDGSRTHSTKMPDEQFYRCESKGLLKWEKVIKPHLPISLAGARFLEIGCNAGLYLIRAAIEGAVRVCGVEKHPHFVRQAAAVLTYMRAPIPIALVEGDALELEWLQFSPFDLVILSNSLYWLVYSDEAGFLDNHYVKLASFLEAVSRATRYMMVVGAEVSLRYANLETSMPMIAESFDILEAKILPLNDRTLNVVVGRSKHC